MRVIAVAQIGKPRGAKGAMWFERYMDDFRLFVAGEVLQLGLSGDRTESFQVETCFAYEKGTVLKLEGVDTPDEAGRLKGAEVFLPEDQVPEDGPDVFDTRDVLGYAVVDRRRGRIGTVDGVSQGPAYWTFHVRLDKGQADVPAVKGLGVELDKEGRTIRTDLPEGYPGLPGEDDAD